MKVLLHCCCAPCSIGSLSILQEEVFETELFWYNPNIHPYTEYKSRLESLSKFADNESLKLYIEGEYGLDLFLDKTYGKKENRHEVCYYLRLFKTASFAAEKGFEYFSTSLLISPYQNHELIKQIGEESAKQNGVKFLYRDFRPMFHEGKSKAKDMGLYMQKYCGCIFSEEERYLKRNLTQRTQSAFLRNDAEDAEKNIIKEKDSKLSEGQQFSVLENSDNIFQRLELLTGEDGLQKLKNTCVIIFGIGGVGSWCAEGLVRSGIGKIDIVDFDKVSSSNINRQIQATIKTVGKIKVEVLKERLLEINPECVITAHEKLFSMENAAHFNIKSFDYVIDAIDMVKNKIDLIQTATEAGVTLFSSMGMALKKDPANIKISSIWKTDVCPLARLVRQGLRKRGFTGDFKVVYSDEDVNRNFLTPQISALSALKNKRVNGSIVNVTASAGFFLASLVVREVLNNDK